MSTARKPGKPTKYFSAEEQAVRREMVKEVSLTCPRCSAKFVADASTLSSEDRSDFYTLRNPPPMFGLCARCKTAELALRDARLVQRKVVCTNCSRQLVADLLSTDTRVEVDRCSACTPTEVQPREGQTFRNLHRATDRRSGRFAGVQSQRQHSKLEKNLDYNEALEEKNQNSDVREQVYSPDFVEKAQLNLAKQSIRDVRRYVAGEWNPSYETVRQAIRSIMQLKGADLEPGPTPPSRIIEHKKPRKCEHGVWMHRDDRIKSRHCSACHPNQHADLVQWTNEKSDGEIVALYETGANVQVLADRLHMTQQGIRAALARNEVELRPEDESTKKREKFVRSPKPFKLVAESDQPEEFGEVPLDPQTLVSQELPC